MMLLLLFWLPLIFIASISGVEEKRVHRITYCFGMLIGGIVFALVSFIMPPPITYTDTLMQYWIHSFLADAVVPLLCLLVCYIPVSYFISYRSCTAGTSFLLGLLTIRVYTHLFAMSNNPKIFPFAFIVLSYTCAILIFKTATGFSGRFSFPGIFSYLIGSISFMSVCAAGFFASAVWYFNGSVLVYCGIVFLLIGLGATAEIAAAVNR